MWMSSDGGPISDSWDAADQVTEAILDLSAERDSANTNTKVCLRILCRSRWAAKKHMAWTRTVVWHNLPAVRPQPPSPLPPGSLSA